jgi:hypothetical protein
MTPADDIVQAISALPGTDLLIAILVGASLFAYGVTWGLKPLVVWLLRGKDDGKAHAWIIRLVSVAVGAGIGVGLAAVLKVGLIWGLVCGTGGGAMTTIAVGLRKAAIRRVVGGDE